MDSTDAPRDRSIDHEDVSGRGEWLRQGGVGTVPVLNSIMRRNSQPDA